MAELAPLAMSWHRPPSSAPNQKTQHPAIPEDPPGVYVLRLTMFSKAGREPGKGGDGAIAVVTCVVGVTAGFDCRANLSHLPALCCAQGKGAIEGTRNGS
jgi:hypothetical protein